MLIKKMRYSATCPFCKMENLFDSHGEVEKSCSHFIGVDNFEWGSCAKFEGIVTEVLMPKPPSIFDNDN